MYSESRQRPCESPYRLSGDQIDRSLPSENPDRQSAATTYGYAVATVPTPQPESPGSNDNSEGLLRNPSSNAAPLPRTTARYATHSPPCSPSPRGISN